MRLIISLAQMKILSRLQAKKPPANQKQGRCFIPRAIKRNVFSKSTDSQALYIHYKPKAIFLRRPGFAHSVIGTLTFQVLLAP